MKVHDIRLRPIVHFFLPPHPSPQVPMNYPSALETLSTRLIRDLPFGKPLQVTPLLVAPNHAEHNRPEQVEQPCNQDIEPCIDRPLHSLIHPAQRSRPPINHESGREDGKVQCRVVVVHIGDTSHGNEGEVVEKPSQNGIEARIVDVVNLVRLELSVPSLPANKIPHDKGTDGQQGEEGAPVDGRVTEKEVLDDVIVPATHTETNVEDWPLPELRGEVVLFVGIGDESIVGGHHRDVEVEEVPEERRSVGARIACGDWKWSVVVLGRTESSLTLLVPVGLHVPMGINIAGSILLGTGDLNLLETPLWEVDVSSA